MQVFEFKSKLKRWHIYTMEYYSAIKRNEIELFVVKWMELESVIQSEVSPEREMKGRRLGSSFLFPSYG